MCLNYTSLGVFKIFKQFKIQKQKSTVNSNRRMLYTILSFCIVFNVIQAVGKICIFLCTPPRILFILNKAVKLYGFGISLTTDLINMQTYFFIIFYANKIKYYSNTVSFYNQAQLVTSERYLNFVFKRNCLKICSTALYFHLIGCMKCIRIFST